MELLPLKEAFDYGISVVVILILAYLLWSVMQGQKTIRESAEKREQALMQFVLAIQPTQESILVILKEMTEDHKELKESFKNMEEKFEPRRNWYL